MLEDVKTSIRLLDACLLMPLRENWKAAKTEKQKDDWLARIDAALDERLKLMALRDELKGSG